MMPIIHNCMYTGNDGSAGQYLKRMAATTRLEPRPLPWQRAT